jgi:hypothetical protein
MMRNLKLSFLVTGALALSGCGDGGTGPDGGNGDTRVIVADPSYADIVQEIFNRRGCSAGSCHGSARSAGLDLRSGSSYGNLVNVSATQVAVDRVIQGNANDSYLIVKVEGRQTVGQRMPLGAAALDNIDLTNLRNWVSQGAKNN